MSDADNDEQSDAADVVIGREEMARGALSSTKAGAGEQEGNGVSHAPIEAVILTREDGAEADILHGVVGVNGAQNVDPACQSATIGVTLPWGSGVDYPIDLFDVLEAWVFEHLRWKLHADFLLSGHFQEYTRFLHVQHRPVTENDFILFRVLGRGGFGAVNGTMTHPAPQVVTALCLCKPVHARLCMIFTVSGGFASPLAGCKRGASGKLFAMKVMNKRRIKIRQSEDLCWNERRILEALGSPFVVSHARLLLGFVSTCHSLAYWDVTASTESFGGLLAFSCAGSW